MLLEIPERKGIYLFLLPKWECGYIGSSVNLKRRYLQHTLKDKCGNKHIAKYLKNHNDLDYMIIEYLDGYSQRDIKIIEESWIEHYKRKGLHLLNVSKPTEEAIYEEPKAVLKYDLEGNFIAEYSSINEAARSVKKPAGNLCTYLNGKVQKGRQTSGISRYGFFWFYKENFNENKIKESIENYKSYSSREYMKVGILQYDLTGNLINSYTSLDDVQTKTNFNKNGISSCALGKCKTYKNFIWIYEKEFSFELLNLRLEKAKGYKTKKVVQINPHTNEILKEWSGIPEITKTYNCTKQLINWAIHSGTMAKGYRWQYVD